MKSLRAFDSIGFRAGDSIMAGHASSHMPDEALRQYVQGTLDSGEAERVRCAPAGLRGLSATTGGSGSARFHGTALSNLCERKRRRRTRPYRGLDAYRAGPALHAGAALASRATSSWPATPTMRSSASWGAVEWGSSTSPITNSWGADEVLKSLDKDIVEQPSMQDRFLREIRAVARLRHPISWPPTRRSEAAKTWYFAMEYVEGLDLARMVKAKGPCRSATRVTSVKDDRRIVFQVALAEAKKSFDRYLEIIARGYGLNSMTTFTNGTLPYVLTVYSEIDHGAAHWNMSPSELPRRTRDRVARQGYPPLHGIGSSRRRLLACQLRTKRSDGLPGSSMWS